LAWHNNWLFIARPPSLPIVFLRSSNGMPFSVLGPGDIREIKSADVLALDG
jgi:hypothetical protein